MGVSERASLTFTKIPPGITGVQECRFGCEFKFSHTYRHANYYGILHVLLLFEQAYLSFTAVLWINLPSNAVLKSSGCL